MGITIWSRSDKTKNTSMGYIRFSNIRMDIAKAYNYELGTIYESHYKTFDHDAKKELEKRFESIYHIADRKTRTLMDFLCKKDTGASASKNNFTYASKLPKSQRFGKSSMILSQVLNLLKYCDFADKFKPLKFTPHLVEI